jgi:hypothetical protein
VEPLKHLVSVASSLRICRSYLALTSRGASLPNANDRFRPSSIITYAEQRFGTPGSVWQQTVDRQFRSGGYVDFAIGDRWHGEFHGGAGAIACALGTVPEFRAHVSSIVCMQNRVTATGAILAVVQPFVDEPREETDRVEPGNPKLPGEKCVAGKVNWLLAALKVY